MKIIKIGANEYWRVPRGVNPLEFIKEGVRVINLDKLPPNVVKVGMLSNGMEQWVTDVNAQNAQYQRIHRQNQKNKGLSSITVWVPADKLGELKDYARSLR